ncbi:ATPase [Enterococcus sp. JM4C]|uniref:AAA family ATPase n=1 Tax=Candidatus Enterococcus huntleyi TaxID=1857217 RepID=UPI00137B22C7|nr:AAA family ATPase [Enterococcus sp. JM4C]KAF1299116.1 ATPase [Enterococcus sp. JM4C]
MKYIRSIQLSSETVKNPNLYPYNNLKGKTGAHFSLDTITMFYGSNGSGKSTLLNLIASKLKIKGAEEPMYYGPAAIDYVGKYVEELQIFFEETEDGKRLRRISPDSYYIKSEDILYEIKKIQQAAILEEGYIYKRKQLGMTQEQAVRHKDSYQMQEQIERLLFAQEKYSNGETAMHIYEDYLVPGGVYLLDEPEASLSAKKQLELVEIITKAARFFDCQFLIATHSPLLLGSLEGIIYDMDQDHMLPTQWTQLENVRIMAEFFQKYRDKF